MANSVIKKNPNNVLVFYEMLVHDNTARYYSIKGIFTGSTVRFPFMVLVGNQDSTKMLVEPCLHQSDNTVSSLNGRISYADGTLTADTGNAGSWCRCLLIVKNGDFIPS